MGSSRARPSHAWVVVSAIIAVSAVALLLVNPRGEFPLNDDWLYARTVEQFRDTGRLVKPHLAAVSLVLQTLWGTAASALFGFSHTTLRLSAFLLHLVAALATAAAVGRCAGFGRATFAGLMILLSPLGLVSAFSFMPEAALEAAIALTVLAAMLWEERQTAMRGMALAVAAATTYLVHPVALLVPLWVLVRAWGGVAPGLSPTGSSFGSLWIRVLPGSVALVGAIPFLLWYLSGSTAGTMSGMWMSRSRGIEVPVRFFSRLAPAMPYVGLSLLPLGLALFSWRRTLLPTCLLLWAWGQAWWLGAEAPFPLPGLENVLHQAGLGFVGVQGTPPALPVWFWMAMSLASLASFLGLFGRVLSPLALPAAAGVALSVLPWVAGLILGESVLRAVVVGIIGLACWMWAFRGTFQERGTVLLALVWLGVLLALPPFYDRYVVYLLPLLVVGAVPHLRRTRMVAWASLAVMGVLSVIGTHDCLAWNRARWEQIAAVEARGVSPDEIDGGYEWAGWRHAWRGTSEVPSAAGAPWWIQLWAPQIVPRWVIALSPIPGYRTENVVECPTIVPGWRICVLRRPEPGQNGGGDLHIRPATDHAPTGPSQLSPEALRGD